MSNQNKKTVIFSGAVTIACIVAVTTNVIQGNWVNVFSFSILAIVGLSLVWLPFYSEAYYRKRMPKQE
jgi:hypothetical protein